MSIDYFKVSDSSAPLPLGRNGGEGFGGEGILISVRYKQEHCGVGDFSYQLAQHLQQLGMRWWVAHRISGGWQLSTPDGSSQSRAASLSALLLALPTRPLLYWQYVPYSFHSKGLPLQLPATMRRLAARGYRHYIFFHEVALRRHGYGWRQWLLGHLQMRIARRMLATAQAAATSIPLFAGYFQPALPCIPVGSNVPFAGLAQHPPFATRLLCFANRCTPALLQALAIVQQAHPQWCWQLQLAGPIGASEQAALQQQAAVLGVQSHLQWLGALSTKALGTWLAQGHLLLQPQPLYRHSEGGVSNKNGTVAAAFMMGLPVLTTLGDMTDTSFFEHGHNCWLLPDNEAGTWAQALVHLLPHQALRSQLGAAAHRRYQQQLAWPRLASLHADLLSRAK
jgi:hypothetical protein